MDITKARWLIAHNFVDNERDPDDAALADLAPGGYDDATTSSGAERDVFACLPAGFGQTVHLDFNSASEVKQFRDDLQTAAARNINWGKTETDVIRAIVRHDSEVVQLAQQPVA